MYWGKDIRGLWQKQAIQYLLSQALASGTQIVSNEINMPLQSGRVVDFVVDAVPLIEAGRVMGCIVVCKDVTQLKETECRMQHLEAQAAIGHMAEGFYPVESRQSYVAAGSGFGRIL